MDERREYMYSTWHCYDSASNRSGLPLILPGQRIHYGWACIDVNHVLHGGRPRGTIQQMVYLVGRPHVEYMDPSIHAMGVISPTAGHTHVCPSRYGLINSHGYVCCCTRIPVSTRMVSGEYS